MLSYHILTSFLYLLTIETVYIHLSGSAVDHSLIAISPAHAGIKISNTVTALEGFQKTHACEVAPTISEISNLCIIVEAGCRKQNLAGTKCEKIYFKETGTGSGSRVSSKFCFNGLNIPDTININSTAILADPPHTSEICLISDRTNREVITYVMMKYVNITLNPDGILWEWASETLNANMKKIRKDLGSWVMDNTGRIDGWFITAWDLIQKAVSSYLETEIIPVMIYPFDDLT